MTASDRPVWSDSRATDGANRVVDDAQGVPPAVRLPRSLRRGAAVVKYRILGRLEVRSERGLVEVGPPKQRAVLAMLLLQANQVVSLDRLIDQLWGDAAPPQAISSLRAYVANLRRVLEPDRAPGSRPGVLVTRPPGYLLNADPSSIDAFSFESLALTGHQLLQEGRVGQAATVLLEAHRLWAGVPLAEFASEAFAEAEVTRWQELYRGVREDKVAADLALGGHAVVVAELESMLVEHPLRERLWAMLMTAQYRSGRQADALQAFQRARRVLVTELGVDPGPELRRLEADILSQAESLDVAPTSAEGSSPGSNVALVAPRITRTPRQADAATIVGRGEELRQLDDAFERAARGTGGVVFIQGEPGIGKTRLVTEFAAGAGSAEATVRWGRCHESAGAPPLWPWTAVLDELHADLDGQDVAGGTDPRLRLLSPLLSLRPVATGTTEISESLPARFGLFETIFSVLQDAARGPGALIVVLEDFHWADVASVQLLQHLAARIQVARILMVVTYRASDLAEGHPLADALGALAIQRGVSLRTLAGLTLPQVGELVEQSTGDDVAGPLVRTIWERTGGNAFFVTELVSLLVSEKRLNTDDAARSIPPGVLGVVRRRLARLPDQTKAVLAIAAVLGREFDLTMLQSVSGLGAEEVLDAIEVALLTNLVSEHGKDEDAFHFVHALTHDAVYQGISRSRRIRLHARAAQTMSARGRTDAATVSMRAHHAWCGRGVLPVEETVRCLLQAADVSRSRFGWEDGERMLRQASSVLDSAPAGPDRDRQEIKIQFRLGQLMRATRGLADPETAEPFRRAQELAVGLEPDADVLESIEGAWGVSLSRGDVATATRLGEAILALGENGSEPTFRMVGNFAIGASTCYSGNPGRALRHLDAALTPAPGSAATTAPRLVRSPLGFPVTAVASSFRAMALWLMDKPAEAWASARSATALARLESPYGAVLCLQLELSLALLEGDFAAVGRCLAEQAQLHKQFGVAPEHVTHGSIMAGWAAIHEGHVTGGLAQVEDGWSAVRDSPTRMEHPFRLLVLADARHFAGQLDSARQALEEALIEMDTTGVRWPEAEVRRTVALRLHDLGGVHRAQAHEALHQAESVAMAQGAEAFARRARQTRRRWTHQQ
ncbi:BTAD domain-containing putative transcriptional regulator [Actinoplanes sp. NPDC051513]|uniref:BTAD domain-containing putative transcriptional regulator n=1 Tax=Actinoplanes sp. NPDC051513 TaxID=3363908 RepID=UPI0037B3749E